MCADTRMLAGCVAVAACRSIVGFKATAGFKATEKSGGNNAIATIKNLGTNLVNAMNGNSAAATDSLPVSQPPLAAAANPKPVAPPKYIIGPNGHRVAQRPMTQAEVMQVCFLSQQRVV
jgi:hypothetical protein